MRSASTQRTALDGGDGRECPAYRLICLLGSLAVAEPKEHIAFMVSKPDTETKNKPKAVALGRSAATGRIVLMPALNKKSSVSDKRIDAAVKSVLSKTK